MGGRDSDFCACKDLLRLISAGCAKETRETARREMYTWQLHFAIATVCRVTVMFRLRRRRYNYVAKHNQNYLGDTKGDLQK